MNLEYNIVNMGFSEYPSIRLVDKDPIFDTILNKDYDYKDGLIALPFVIIGFYLIKNGIKAIKEYRNKKEL
jgi:hypothetical protein